MNKVLTKLLIVVSSLFATTAFAWNPPSTVKVIVGQSPGGGNEFAFRGIDPILEKNISGTRFVIEHRPGLDNVVAMNHFAEQRPDGSNIFVVVQATGFVAAPVAYESQLKVDPMKYSFVTTLAKSPMAFIIHPNSRFKTVSQLIAHLQDEKTKANIGISGSINLLAYSYFLEKIGVPIDRAQSIRFNSPTEASVAVASGSIDLAIVPMSVPKPLIDAGKVKLLAHTGSTPIPSTESAELMKDHVPGFILDAAWSVFLPPGTPSEITKWYSDTFVNALKDPAAKKYYETNWAVIDKNALGQQGLTTSISDLRRTWMPISKKVLKAETK